MSNKVVTIFGRRGSGKSTLTEQLVKDEKRLIVIDPMGEYQNGVVFYSLPEMYQHLIRHGEKSFRCVYYPLNDQAEVEQICEYAIALENLTLVIEEIDMYCTPNTILDKFNYVLRRGRHHNINVFCVSQRPFGINRIVTSQSTEVISFLQKEPRDVNYLVELFGKEAEKVSFLKPYQYIRFAGNEITVHGGHSKKIENNPLQVKDSSPKL